MTARAARNCGSENCNGECLWNSDCHFHCNCNCNCMAQSTGRTAHRDTRRTANCSRADARRHREEQQLFSWGARLWSPRAARRWSRNPPEKAVAVLSSRCSRRRCFSPSSLPSCCCSPSASVRRPPSSLCHAVTVRSGSSQWQFAVAVRSRSSQSQFAVAVAVRRSRTNERWISGAAARARSATGPAWCTSAARGGCSVRGRSARRGARGVERTRDRGQVAALQRRQRDARDLSG